MLAAEHKLYPRCLRLVAEGRVRVVGNRALLDAGAAGPVEDAGLAVPS